MHITIKQIIQVSKSTKRNRCLYLKIQQYNPKTCNLIEGLFAQDLNSKHYQRADFI